MKELEQFVGVSLIERTTRSQRLTEAGREFLPHVRALIEAWQTGLRDVKASLEEPVGTLRLTASSYLYAAGVGQAIAQFTQDYPNVAVETHASDRLQALRDGDFDVAIRVSPRIEDPTLHTTRLRTERDIIVASPRIAEDLHDVSRPEQLSSARWVVHAELPRSRTFHGATGESFELQIPRHVVTDSGPALQALVRQGAGIAILLTSLAHSDLEAGRVVQLLPEWHCGELELCAVCRHDALPSPKISRFTKILREQFAPSEQSD